MNRRLFYAIEFPPGIRHQLAEAACELAAMAGRGRWTRPENLHLTLQFLGSCPDEWIDEFSEICSHAVAGCPSFMLEFSGAGTFGAANDILWVGVRPQLQLTRLAESLAALLKQQRLPCDNRAYFPHVTIGRQVVISPQAVENWRMPVISCPVRQISLMESTQVEGRLAYVSVYRDNLLPMV